MIELGQLERRHEDFARQNARVIVVSMEGAEDAKKTQADFPHLVVLALAGFQWTFLFLVRLPEYTGPVAVGQPFPAFTTQRADGTSFTQRDLAGEQNNVLVFFRGRW